MKPCLAMMFEGIEFLPLIGISILVLAFLALTGVSFAFLHRKLPGRRAKVWSVVLGMTPVLAFIVWSMHYSSPLALPRGASDVRIRRAFPLGLAIDDNLRFRLAKTEFQAWLERLCG